MVCPDSVPFPCSRHSKRILVETWWVDVDKHEDERWKKEGMDVKVKERPTSMFTKTGSPSTVLSDTSIKLSNECREDNGMTALHHVFCLALATQHDWQHVDRVRSLS